MHDEHASSRAAAGVAALCAAVLGLFALGFAAWAFPVRPDPTIPDGDPCCSHPDTWEEVWDTLPWFVTWVLLAALLFTLAAALAYYMAIGARPRARALLAVPGAMLALTAIGVAVSLT